jgi:hypothetical protein
MTRSQVVLMIRYDEFRNMKKYMQSTLSSKSYENSCIRDTDAIYTIDRELQIVKIEWTSIIWDESLEDVKCIINFLDTLGYDAFHLLELTDQDEVFEAGMLQPILYMWIGSSIAINDSLKQDPFDPDRIYIFLG